MEKEQYWVVAKNKANSNNLNDFVIVGKYDSLDKAQAVLDSEEIKKYFDDLDRELILI